MNIPKCLRKKFWNIYKNTLTELSNIYIALNVNWLFVINYQILDNGGKSEFKWVINLSLFFFFLMVFCVIVYLCWREEMIWSTRKLRLDFEATNVLCCPLGRYAEKVMAIMQTYGDGQTGGGGVKKQRFRIGSCKQIRPISYYDFGVFLDRDGVACNPCPPPFPLLRLWS